MEQPITVSQLVAEIRQLVEGVPKWQKVWVIGELSGVKHHTSGHWYFTLKDATAQMRAVMFRRSAQTLSAPLRDGMAVMAFGRVGVFERDGQTQLYISMIRDMGRGTEDLALQLLKQKLYDEGLFSRPKRGLPLLPRAIAVVTSASGAARYDIETVIARRYPGMGVILYPVTVQGDKAAESIVKAMQSVAGSIADVVIMGRGGGSKEDLAAFNDERVVRAVFQCPVPVISAVGHEIDTTLVDLVADLRAPTPSAAAELAVPELAQLRLWLKALAQRLDSALVRRVSVERGRLSGWVEHGLLAHPDRLYRDYRHQVDRLTERNDRAFERIVHQAVLKHTKLVDGLRLLNPELPLDRGYTYVTDESGQLTSFNAVQWEKPYRVHWTDGSWWMTPIRRGDANHDR